MAADGSHEAKATQQPQDLQGRRFYSPGTVAGYCLFSPPVGLCLLGLNAARRGSRSLGYLLAGLSGVVFLGALATAAAGSSVSGFGVFGAFLAIGLFRMEYGPYRLALSRGGVAARWWPPLLWVLASLVLLVAVTPSGGPQQLAK